MGFFADSLTLGALGYNTITTKNDTPAPKANAVLRPTDYSANFVPSPAVGVSDTMKLLLIAAVVTIAVIVWRRS